MNDLKNSVRPEDFLPDSENTATINGVMIRKGSIGAFFKNISLLDNPNQSEQQLNDIYAVIQELAPAMVAVGLYKHATFKNDRAQQILEMESKNLKL